MSEYMKEAIRLAEIGISEGHGGPFGCVIVKNGKIVGRGHNTVIGNEDCTQHGEINAIQDACATLGHDLSGCELYTTSYPCLMCAGAIAWSNIKKVHYGCTIKDAENIGFRDNIFGNAVDYKKLPIQFVECSRAECLKLFDKYKKGAHKLY